MSDGPRDGAADLPDPTRTRRVYERQALRYETNRSHHMTERSWLERFAAGVPQSGHVLDLGCGSGEPIGAWLTGAGFRVTGVDFAEPMLELARKRWPGGDWRHADMRELDLPELFDGIIAWDSFFHLTPDEQEACIPRLARHLAPGGALMLTVGPDAGETGGTVGDERVYHASLSPDDYRAQLNDCGLSVIDFVANDPACGGHSVLLSQKQGLRLGT